MSDPVSKKARSGPFVAAFFACLVPAVLFSAMLVPAGALAAPVARKVYDPEAEASAPGSGAADEDLRPPSEPEHASEDAPPVEVTPGAPALAPGATGDANARAAEAETPPPDTHRPPGELEMSEPHPAPSVRFEPGRGLAIRSDDGQFGLTTRVRLQIRYSLDDEPGTELRHELTLRRARLAFTGHFFGEDNRFKLELALSPRDQGIGAVFDNEGPEHTPLLDYYLEFRQLRELTLRIGQYKVPFSRQRVISSGNLQMVDRSIVNSGFNLDRDVGFDFRSRDLFGVGLFRYYAGVYIGQGRDAVGADAVLTGASGLMYIARIEVLPFGLFDDYQEADFARSLTPRLSIGAAFAAVDRAYRDRGILGRAPADGGTTNTQHFAADAVFMYAGFSFFTEFQLRVGQRNPGDAVDVMGLPIPPDPSADGWGLVAQAGYLLPDLPIEIAARYGTVQPLGPQSGMSERNELGLAVSYYFGQHPFKVQVDCFRLWRDRFDTGDMRLRIQLQASL